MDIRTELTDHLEVVDKQIEAIKSSYSQYVESDIYLIRYKTGEYVMVPLLVAKAQILATLASLSVDHLGYPAELKLSEQYGRRV